MNTMAKATTLLVSIVVLFVLFSSFPGEAEALKEAPKSLQVGVKFRPDVCERKSTKGDTLEMHCALVCEGVFGA